ncbi:MAG: T9SS type A sorting domain-containing protein [Bacteroidia bacterium]|nr:T9SS type A sorting domain-containing protein [Bacteroidia bacterium]
MLKFYYFLITLLLAPAHLLGQAITADLGQDSLHVCAFEPMLLSVNVLGGLAPYSYTWSDGSTGNDLWYVPVNGGEYVWVIVTDHANSATIDSVWIHGHAACVWPGDANGDGIANNADILPLGLSFGHTGPQRPNAHLQWTAQPADLWSASSASGVNYVHSDTDGNGVVNENDLVGILHNYLVPQTMPGVSTSGGGVGVPLYVDFPSTNFNPGDTIVAAIMLGTTFNPADSVYGIAFTVEYDALLFDSGSLKVVFDQSWLGDIGVDMIGLHRDFYNASQVDIGITRTNQQVRFGAGQIASIIVTVDDIAGKNNGIEMVNFNISHVSMTDKNGAAIQVNPGSSQVGISLSNEPSFPDREREWKVYPNPATSQITISGLSGFSPQANTRVSLCDMLGRTVYTEVISALDTTIDTSAFPRGQYMLSLEDNDGRQVPWRIVLK